MADIQGTCDARFEPVKQAFAANFEQGLDVGASAAVVYGGELVVDIWAGHADEAKTTPWHRDTIINVWSTTKTMTALCAVMLADRGELDLHGKVATYWPEFAANGKGDVEVSHLMAHSAGLSGWAEPMAPDDLYDWEKATSILAAQAPFWEPGTASGYHAITQGYLVGEVVRRVAGESVGTFFAKEVAGPLGADFHIGTPEECDDRVARVIPPPPLPIPENPSEVLLKTFGNPPIDATQSWTVPWRRAEIPAAGGHGNARSVALAQSALSHGGEVAGVRLLSAKGCEIILEPQVSGVDLVLGVPMTFGMNYGLNSADLPISPNPRACFWGGWGGSIIVNDLDAGITIAYVMNKMGEGTLGDVRGANVVMAAFTSLAG